MNASIKSELDLATIEIKAYTKQLRQNSLLFLSSCIPITLTLAPIVLNVGLYNDDFGRASSGSLRWESDGRIIASLLYKIAHLGAERTVYEDPLGYIICFPLAILGGIFLSLLFRKKSAHWPGLLSILIFGQPFFLENLSYSFDAPLMTLSVVMCLAAAWLCVRIEGKISALISGSLITLSLLTYQSANNAFWIPICLVFIDSLGKGKNYLKSLTGANCPTQKIIRKAFFLEAASLLTYKLAFTPLFTLSDYTKHVQQLPSPENLIFTIFSNINYYCDNLLRDGFNSPLGITISTYVIASILLIAWNKNIKILMLKLFSLFVVLALSQGVMNALSFKGLPYRTFIGFGSFISCLAPLAWDNLMLNTQGKRANTLFKYFFISLISAVCWGLISCSHAYSSAFKSQEALNLYYRQTISNAIASSPLYNQGHLEKMVIINKSPLSRVAKNTFKTYPFLSSIISGIGGDSKGIRLFQDYGVKLKRAKSSNIAEHTSQKNKSEELLRRPDMIVTTLEKTVTIHFP